MKGPNSERLSPSKHEFRICSPKAVILMIAALRTLVGGNFPGIFDENVYVVLMPESNGKAGCASIIIVVEQRRDFDWGSMMTYLKKQLP